jgi:hypothetical protein
MHPSNGDAHAMNYQLVLQFRGESLQGFLAVGNFEGPLEKALVASELFDGLDHGAHGANFFIYTDDPAATLQRIRPLLGQAQDLPGFAAAYRTVSADDFRVLWPEGASAAAFKLR